MKKNYMLSLDMELAEEGKRLWPNGFSTKVNEILRLAISSSKKDVMGLNIRAEKYRLERLMDQNQKISIEIQQIKQNISDYEELKNKQKEREALEKKEEIEKLESCNNCGNILTKKFIVNGKQLCSNCFRNL